MNDDLDKFEYYDTLNVTPTATPDEIKSSYHRLLRIWHPDKHGSQPSDAIETHIVEDGEDQGLESHNRNSPFSKIQKAFAVLSDPTLRLLYDKYGSEGVSLAMLMKSSKPMDKNEVHCIEEDIHSEEHVKDGELIETTNDFEKIEKRLLSLLRKRYSQKIKEMPVHVITHFTFGGRTDIFDGIYSMYMNKNYFSLNYTSFENSIEALVYDKFRVGCTLSSVLTRGTFGSCFGRLYLGKNVSETLECIASVDTGDFLTFKRLMFTLKKKFSELFWGTLTCGVDNTGSPNLHAMLHRRFFKNHSLELSLFNTILVNYSYVKFFDKDAKINVKVAISPDDAGAVLRAKSYGLMDYTLAVLIRSSIAEGISLEWYIRRYVDTKFLSVAKIEYRLCLKRNAVVLVLKGLINSSKVSIPIVLFKGDFNYCIFLISALSMCTLMVPLVTEALNKLYLSLSESFPAPEIPASITDLVKDRPQVLRHTFYSQFAIFNLFSNKIIGSDLSDDIELKHDKYALTSISKNDTYSNYSDYLLEGMIINGLKSARNESLTLQNHAKIVHMKEVDKNGLVILFAVYGHPEVVKYLSTLGSLNYYKSMGFGNISITGVLHDRNVTNLDRVYERYALDVTNALMMKVVDSILVISTHSKSELVGFADPCSNLRDTTPLLYIVYTYGDNIKSIIVTDNEPLLLP